MRTDKGTVSKNVYAVGACIEVFFYIPIYGDVYKRQGQDCLRHIQYTHIFVGHVVGGYFPGKFLIVVVCFLPFDERCV